MLKVVPFLTLFMVFLFGSNAFAANDYKNGLLDESGYTIVRGSNLIFDNDLVTYYRTGDINPKVEILLDNEMNITDAYFNVYFSTGDQNLGAINFYDKNKKIVKRMSMPGLRFSGYYAIGANNVKSITFDLGGVYNIHEFDVFGTIVPKDYDPILNLTEEHNHNSVTLKWKNPVNPDVKNVVLRKNGSEVARIAANQEVYTITKLDEMSTYKFEVLLEYSDGGLSIAKDITVTTSSKPEDTKPPSEIVDLTFKQSSQGVSFTWVNPIDDDFSHIRIYRDGLLIESEYHSNKYEVNDLVPNTTYLYKFVAIDTSGNASNGYVQAIKTDIEVDNVAPSIPTGLNVSVGNQSGRLTWDKNSESDIKGYYVYINGVKHNSALLLTNYYVITGLKNTESYSVTVTAVDTSGNESLFSLPVLLTPDKNSMPTFKPEFDLKDVSIGTSNWFSSIWPILAFAVAIPLAFLVSRRVKTLFLA